MTATKETRGFSNFGFSTILLSFVMICVVTFSALSLVTAYSDYKLSKKVADKNTSYYLAQENAYDKLFALEYFLTETYQNTSNSNDYYRLLAGNLSDFGIVNTIPDGYELSFTESISEEHHLSVKLKIVYPSKEDDHFYQLLEWKSVYTKTEPEQNTLNLIQ